MGVYVDDLLIAGPRSLNDVVIKAVQGVWKTSQPEHLGPDADCVPVLRFLGVNLERVDADRSAVLNLPCSGIYLVEPNGIHHWSLGEVQSKPPVENSNNARVARQSRVLCNKTYYFEPNWWRLCRIPCIPPSSSARRDRWGWCSRKEEHEAPLQFRAESHQSTCHRWMSKMVA